VTFQQKKYSNRHTTPSSLTSHKSHIFIPVDGGKCHGKRDRDTDFRRFYFSGRKFNFQPVKPDRLDHAGN